MGSITYCDFCNTQKPTRTEDRWLDISMYGHGEEIKKQFGDVNILNYDLCPRCTKKVLKPLLKLLKKKK